MQACHARTGNGHANRGRTTEERLDVLSLECEEW